MQKRLTMNLNNLTNKITPEKTFLILAFIFGILFTFAVPPFQVADEATHFARIYELSNFKFIGKKVENKASGDFMPKDVVYMIRYLEGSIKYHPENKFRLAKLKNYVNRTPDLNNKIFVDFKNTVLYSPIVYLPQVTGMIVAKWIPAQPLLMIYLARLFSLFAFIALAYGAIKLTPIYKWGFALLSLMPMTLHQAASLSADAFCFGLSFFFIAFILHCALSKDEKIQNKQILLIILMSALLGLCKSIYCLMPLLFLAIPSAKFNSKKQYCGLFLGIMATTFWMNLMWSLIIHAIYLPIDPLVNPYKQLLYMLTQPQHYLIGLGKTFVDFGKLHSFVGTLGWLDNPIPSWLAICYLVVLALTAIFENYKDTCVNLKQKIVIGSTFTLTFILIQTFLYLSCTIPGADYILGVQGRYFIPIAPLALIPFYNKITDKFDIMNKNANVFLLFFLTMTLCVTLFCIIQRYYFV